MGINAHSSVDPRWIRHHNITVRGFLTAEIEIIRKNPSIEPTYDQATGKWSGNFITVWNGNARIKPYGIVGDMIVAQDMTARRLMRFVVDDRETGVNVDDMIIVNNCDASPELTSFEFEVRGTVGSSDSWMTDIVVEANLKAQF